MSAFARQLRPTSEKQLIELLIGAALLLFLAAFPGFGSGYWVSFVLTQTFLIGIAAASLIFLTAYGGMVSLAQTALYGIAAFALGNMVTRGEVKGLHLGLNPWLAVVLAALLVLHGLAETVTLSRLIEAAPPLRWFDRLGRRRAQVPPAD